MGSRRLTNSGFQCLQIAKHEALRNVQQFQRTNFVFSPLSIQLALSLLANGSKGSTKQELLTFLEAENLHDLNSGNRHLLNSLTRPSKGCPVVTLAGGIWVDQCLHLNPKFASIAEDIYNARAETVNFQDEASHKEIIDKVNKWAEEATNGVIKSVLPPNAFSSQRVENSLLQPEKMYNIVLGNALYFKGRWSKQFMKSLTQEHKFYLLDGNSVDVPFMSSSSEQQYIYASQDFKILELPYKMSSISMYIILPSTRHGLLPLLEKVSSDPRFIETYAPKKVSVGAFRIPKFKISYDIEVSGILRSLGLKSCFSLEAEFDEMVLNLEEDILLGSQVLQKSHIEIDEEGTEAAAVTIVHLRAGSALPQETPRVDFVADHPFIYMVKDGRSGMVLFMGHVVNPLL